MKSPSANLTLRVMILDDFSGDGFGISVSSATVLRHAGCAFKIHGSGSQQSSLGQVSGGQIRLGDIEQVTFRIEDGKLRDSEGHGCWWTPPAGVLQCDKNQVPESGFEIGCDDLVSFHGQSNFYQCATGNRNQWNIYQKPGAGTNCGQITLVADDCHADCPHQPAQSSASAPVTKDCPANLDGAYEFPHLIIPVDKSNPDKAYGNSFFGEVTPSRSSIFNFDIPVSDRDKTCTLIFLFPEQSQLETSSNTLYGDGKIHALALGGLASNSTTWNNKPRKLSAGRSAIVRPGQSNSIASWPCSTTQALSFELLSSGNTYLRCFQDYNPAPIGLYIAKC
ncbi:hypothetical protein E4U57_003084 [Claviceps arundinis]|uniref:Ubiquitin 3 binding protein But2 C-terminal domain-containing protein n=1 Tax=Claviceps arundinis TaxID=1623583 RepID=A0ABQ7P7N6_9HYPO|nr:hypothetical protein E4U57_003084 [Claviceps arundinis]